MSSIIVKISDKIEKLLLFCRWLNYDCTSSSERIKMLAMRPPFYHTLFFYGPRYLCGVGGGLGIGYLLPKLVCNAHIEVS